MSEPLILTSFLALIFTFSPSTIDLLFFSSFLTSFSFLYISISTLADIFVSVLLYSVLPVKSPPKRFLLSVFVVELSLVELIFTLLASISTLWPLILLPLKLNSLSTLTDISPFDNTTEPTVDSIFFWIFL